MGKVIIFAAEGVQDEEFFVPYHRFKEEFEVIVATPDDKPFKGKYGIPYKGDLYSTEHALVTRKNDDILYIPGGYQCPEILRQDKYTLECILKHEIGAINGSSGLIISICHGPQVLISAGICRRGARGRSMTCYQGMKADLINAGANYSTNRVEVDDNIITAQHYNDLPEFHKTVIQHYHLRNSVIH